MKTYNKVEIEKFLLAIDENLKKPFDLIVIGGTAAALAYQVSNFTKDIDTVNNVLPILSAYKAAIKKTGLNIPLGPVGVEDGPWLYEDRLVEYRISGMTKLKIKVPERHDLVLMKMVRGQENDIDTACQIHKNVPLQFEIIIDRILSEMTQVIGNKLRIKNQFLALIERLFGDMRLKEAEKQLKNWEK